jgi:hypothetical protein
MTNLLDQLRSTIVIPQHPVRDIEPLALEEVMRTHSGPLLEYVAQRSFTDADFAA